MSEGAATLLVHGETLVLHPERAVLWPARHTLVVADTHFGKSGVFRHHGMAVPAGVDERDRLRLSRLVQSTRARRLIILGDFLHAPLDRHGNDARALAGWCESLADTDIQVIAGNHDRGVPGRWLPPVRWREADLIEPPFCFTHDAERADAAGTSLDADGEGAAAAPPVRAAFTLSGHVHPVVRLRGLRKRAPRVPVFWQRAGGLVLPAFGGFTGGFAVTPARGERVFAAGPQTVVPFPVCL